LVGELVPGLYSSLEEGVVIAVSAITQVVATQQEMNTRQRILCLEFSLKDTLHVRAAQHADPILGPGTRATGVRRPVRALKHDELATSCQVQTEQSLRWYPGLQAV